MGCVSKFCRSIAAGILSLIKVGVSVAIIIIVARHLYKTDIDFTLKGITGVKPQCLMMGSVKGASVCEYTFAVCGFSLLLSLLSSFLLCVTCDFCGLGDWFQFIVQGIQTAWWVIAAIIISKNVRDSNEYQGVGLPNEGWRDAVAVLCWVNSAAAFLCAVIFLFQACKCLKNCCSCCCDDDDDYDKRRTSV